MSEHDLSPSAHLIKRLKMLDLAFNEGYWFLGGSAPLALRDIRRVGDIDIGVTTAYWSYLLRDRQFQVWTPSDEDPETKCDPPYLVTEVDGIEAHFFFTWRRRTADETRYNDFNQVFRDGIEEVRGFPCIKLAVLLRQKVDALQWENVRPKDITDINSIMRCIAQAQEVGQ